jgi:hypothetical protein
VVDVGDDAEVADVIELHGRAERGLNGGSTEI